MDTRKFEKAVVIFVDILGTQDRKNFNEWYEIVSLFNDTVGREKALDKTHEHTIYKREIHMFSDCAYIIYDYKEGIEEGRKNINALMSIACYNTEKVLYSFLKNGFIFRGAVTYGDIYYEADRNLCFGPAMNKAYGLESRVAKYPRVIIDPEFADNLVDYNNGYYRSSEFQRITNGEIIKRDEDGYCYIHFLNSTQLGFSQFEDEDVMHSVLELCDREKSKKRESDELKESILAKYDWLEKYVINSQYQGQGFNSIDITNPEIMKQIENEELSMIRNLNL